MSEYLAQHWIDTLGLTRHPEGGWFKETYRAEEMLPQNGLSDRFEGERPVATSIYFLLESGDASHLHRIKSDEIWNFHAGSALTLYIIEPAGKLVTQTVGPAGNFQVVVPAGHWFGAKVKAPNSYCLVGCTVAPGFDFADFELGERTALLAEFPQHADLITLLT